MTLDGGFEAWAQRQLDAVEAALGAWVPADAPVGLGEAMRMSSRTADLDVCVASQATWSSNANVWPAP